MSGKDSTETALPQHGAARLPSLNVDAYNAELRDAEGFIGDRASNRAFRSILEDWRERLRRIGEDPLGDAPSEEISKKKIDKLLADGDPEAAGLVHGVIEEFAQELVAVIHRLLRLKTWRDTERIVVGGGLRDSRAGELAIGRAAVILKGEGHAIDLSPIRHHPDEAGLIGAAHLAPSWLFRGHDSILGVDIGGSNIRTGVMQLNLEKHPDLSCVKVWESDLWRHEDEEPTREDAVERLAEMLRGLIARAEKKDLRLAPFVGIGCPGLIEEDGSIERGGQNLPGNWESKRFNLPRQLLELIPRIGEHDAIFLMHNDAVVQGLSELPFMADVARWGVLTIGTGLGNARFTNRRKDDD
jgi:predicted NBD/HSP70 family sugar kinase